MPRKRSRPCDDGIDVVVGHGTFGVVRRCGVGQVRKESASPDEQGVRQDMVRELVLLTKHLPPHDHLVAVTRVERLGDGRWALVMPEASCALVALVGAPLPDGRLACWKAALLAGVSHLHAHGVLHRDLKPGNVLVYPAAGPLGDGHPTLRVADLGGAAVVAHGRTVAHCDVCTWPYCAPEVLRKEPYGSDSDVWSIGMILAEVAEGARVLDGNDAPTVLASLAVVRRRWDASPAALPSCVSTLLDERRAERRITPFVRWCGAHGADAPDHWPGLRTTTHRAIVHEWMAELASVDVLSTTACTVAAALLDAHYRDVGSVRVHDAQIYACAAMALAAKLIDDEYADATEHEYVSDCICKPADRAVAEARLLDGVMATARSNPLAGAGRAPPNASEAFVAFLRDGRWNNDLATHKAPPRRAQGAAAPPVA